MAGSSVVGTLKAILSMDTAEFEAGSARAAKTSKKTETTLRDLGAAIGAAFSLQQFASLAHDTTTAASAIEDLAQKMGIGTAAVQELGFAAKANGASIDQIGQALALMGNRLVEGDKSTVGAVNALGLSLDSLRKMAPDQAFTAIATAISQVADPMERSKLALDLFGRAGADLLPVLTANIAGLRQEARDMGAVMSDELIKKGDQLDDSWAAMQQRVNTVKSEAMIPLLEVFLKMPAPIQAVIGFASEFSGVLSGLALAVMAAGGPVAAFGLLKVAAVGLSETLLGAVAAIGAVPLAIGAAAAALFIYREDIMRDLGGLKYLPNLFADIVKSVKSGAASIGSSIASMASQSVAAVKSLYEGVKTWLVDRFSAIVDGVKTKIDAVTGFFRDMYDKVVGHSYVPDMVTAIGQEMERLEPLMVEPVERSAKAVETSFQQMMRNITNHFNDWGNDLSAFVTGKLGKILGGGLGAVASGLLQSFGTLITGGINNLIALGVNLAMKGLSKLASWIGGLFKGEGAKTNDDRDAWMARLGGFEGSREILAQHPELIPSFERAYHADNRDQFAPAAAEFNALAHDIGVPGFKYGTGGWMDFGAGMPAMLHGQEMVVPKPVGGDLSEAFGSTSRPLILQLDGRTFGRVMFNPLAREAARMQVTQL